MTQSLDIDKMLADAEYAYAMDEECGWDAPDDIIRALRMLKRRTEVCDWLVEHKHLLECASMLNVGACNCGVDKAQAALAYQGEPDA